MKNDGVTLDDLEAANRVQQSTEIALSSSGHCCVGVCSLPVTVLMALYVNPFVAVVTALVGAAALYRGTTLPTVLYNKSTVLYDKCKSKISGRSTEDTQLLEGDNRPHISMSIRN